MKVLLIIILFLKAFSISAQSTSFHHYRVEDGLSHNSVISMLQDRQGFMWFGTKNGLNRFDGYNYKTFEHKPGDTNSIGSNFIRCLHEFKGAIWVGTDTGLFKYNEKMESFSLIESTKDQPILDIENDKKGNLWFIASGNLYKRSLNSDKEEVYKQSYFSFISTSESGKIYVASSENLFEYVEDNDSFQKKDFSYKNNESVIITEIAANVAKDTVFIGTKNNGALIFTLSEGKASSLLNEKENPLFVRNFLRKNNEKLWIASESGIFIYNLKTGEYENFKKNYNDPYSLSDNAIYSLVLDKDEGVWIGTYFGGVNYYPKQQTPIKKYFPKVGENSISGNAVREIKKDKYGDLWIGTEDAGLNKLNLSTGKFKNYPSINNNGNISHYNIHGLLPRGNELWIGTFEHGLDVMNIKTGKIINHYGTGKNEGGLKSDFILYIKEIKNGDIYVLTSSGVFKYLEDSNSFQVVSGFPEIHHYTYLIEDRNGVLWAGTYWDGLYSYDPNSGKKSIFKYNRNDPTSISSNVINGIFEDSDKKLWITTENGLNLYNPEKNNFTRITKEDGFPSNVNYSILEDKNKNLWISTSRGLVEYNSETGAIKILTKSNGLLSDQFNYSSSYKDDSGEMYFGSVNGLISFNQENFIQNTYHPPIFITDIQIHNKEVRGRNDRTPFEKSIIYSEKIQLNHRQSTFNLEFASLSYTAPEMTKYWYKLEGLNNNWISLGKNHEIAFTELPPGNYILKVKSLNSNGLYSSNSKNIEISPPFSKSKTAYVVYTIFFILFLFFLLRYDHRYNRAKRNRKIKQLENEKEKEIYQAKIEFFTNITHEIRTPLTLIMGPLEKLLKSTYKSPEIPRNLGIMEKNTTRLLNLVNELLDFRKTEMRHVKLTFKKININNLLEETYIRFSQMIKEKDLNFNLIKPKEAVLAFVDEEAIRKILSNLFSNTIKYSKNKVEISLFKLNHLFQIIIKNDGELIPFELEERIFEPFYRVPGGNQEHGTGIGLSLSNSLTELHHGRLYCNSKNKMNTFILEIPIHQTEELNTIQQPPSIETAYSENAVISDFHKNAPIILVAEDNRELADFIYSELSKIYNVLIAPNGQDAWNYFLSFDIQLVISDVMMPIKDGIELCKQIKEDAKTNHIPVILLTAKSALNAKIEGLEAGADAYISKPFSMDHLQVQISNLLENRRTILDHYSNSPLAHLKSLSLSEVDQKFLSKLDKIIEENLTDPELNVESLAERMNMSRSTLYRKIKEISDLSPNELINISRLKKAAYLLKTTNNKIYEIAEEVGYRSQTSFGRNFQKEFDMTPSDFMNNKEIKIT
ncbi:MAG: ligand-binding sensor domain-containing protein/signal transduction histidine kinase [Sediminicola sp.]|jgi:ligand-binding sensor domain-containing protein/signal transduction histidine kinase/DNA-binding response OmpR family regulator